MSSLKKLFEFGGRFLQKRKRNQKDVAMALAGLAERAETTENIRLAC